jgi:hypothetical protein
MSLADQFAADAAAGANSGAAQSAPQSTLAQQFAADAAAGAKINATAAKATTPVNAQEDAQAADLAAGGASPDTLSQFGQIGSAAVHGIGSMFNNAANLVEKGVASGLNAIPGVRDTGLARSAMQTANADVLSQANTDQAFNQTASPGQKATAFIAPMLTPMGGLAKAGDAVKAGVEALPYMGNAVGRTIGAGLGNATTGALASAGSPIDPNGSGYWNQVGRNAGFGAGLGVGIPAVLSGGKMLGSSLWDAARPLINPQAYVGQGLASAIGDQAGNVAANIRSAQQFVPGSMPTTAQVGQNPTLVATEKAAANGVPGFRTALATREDTNNQARWDQLNSVARTPADLDAAVAAREAAAGPAYQAARAQTYNVDQDLSDLMQRPAMRDALARGISIARNEGNRGFIPGVNGQPAQYGNVPTGGTAFNGQPTLQQVLIKPASQGQPAQISGDVLHYIKLGLDDLQNTAPQNTKLGPFERKAINDAQSDFMGWLDNASSDYAQGRQAYAANSPPVNTMQAGQQMAERLGGMGRALNTSGAPLITAPGYATALSQALRSQEFGIDPAAQGALENIGRDLQRSTVSNSLRAPGSDTAYNLAAQGWLGRQLYGPTFGGAGKAAKAVGAGAALLTGHPLVAGSIIAGADRIGKFAGDRLNTQLSNFLLDPNALLPYLDAQTASTRNATQQAVPGLFQRQILPAAIGGITRGGLMYSQ